MSQAVPLPAYERAVAVVFKPLFTLLHHSQNATLHLSASIPLLDWLETSQLPLNVLLEDLVRCGKVDLLSGSYHQSILNLLPPKDRSNQIEQTTTYLRKRYGQRSKTLFAYGQIFNPNYINTLNLCCIESIVTSTSDANRYSCTLDRPFVMQEMGKSISVFPTNDRINGLINEYAEKNLSFSALIDQFKAILDKTSDYLFAMINLDQLLKGGITEAQTVMLFQLLFEHGTQCIEDVQTEDFGLRKGYLQAGWYGQDTVKGSLGCINDLFVQDESAAYLYGRYTTLVETARLYKKDKDIRKRLEQLIQKGSMGTVYLCDANATMLRSSVRKLFWRYISEIESVLSSLSDFSYPITGDYDFDDLEEHRVIGKYLSSVVDSKGGSIAELTYLPSLHNYGDAYVPLEGFGSQAHNLHQVPEGRKQRLFTDVLLPMGFPLDEYSKKDDSCLDMGRIVYDLDILDKKCTEYKAEARSGESAVLGGCEVQITKHFKLRQNTVLLDVTLANLSNSGLSCIYGCEIPLSLAFTKLPIPFVQLESKKSIIHTHKESILEQMKSIRVFDEPNSTALTLVADSRFTLLKEDYTIAIATVLGDEFLYQHTLFMPTWEIRLKPGEEQKLTLGLRVERK